MSPEDGQPAGTQLPKPATSAKHFGSGIFWRCGMHGKNCFHAGMMFKPSSVASKPKKRAERNPGVACLCWVGHTKHNQVQETNKQREQKGALPGRKREMEGGKSAISHLTQPTSPNPSLWIPLLITHPKPVTQPPIFSSALPFSASNPSRHK